MAGWTNEDTQNAATKSLGQDYDLWAATHSADAAPWAKLGAEKTGLGEGVIRDLVMVLQSLAGIENGGVAMSQNLRAGVMRGGISGITPQGNVGMISGFDVVTAQAANSMQQSVMRNFTNPVTGLANRRAQGLDQAELGRLGGYMLGQGMGTSNGPLVQGEVMTKDRISSLRKEAEAMRPGLERTDKMRELENLKVGELRITETANMGKFTKMMEDGAVTLKAIKDVFGSSALKDLDDTFQQLLGGTLAETGPRAARARMMGIKSMGTTFFGGDMQAAGTYSLGNQRGLAASVGGQFGVDPATAKEMFGALAATIATQMDTAGIVGAQTQTRNAAEAGKFGIHTRVAGAGEIAAGDQRDVSALLAENPEMIALAHFSQLNSATMTGDQKAQVEAAFKQMREAKTEEDRNALTARGGSLLEKLTGGQQVGNYLAKFGGTAQALSDIRGPELSRLANAAGGLTQNVHEEYVKSRYATDAGLRESMGMTADQMGEYGITTANMSDMKFKGVQEALQETDAEKRKKMLDELGLGKSYTGMLEAEAGRFPGSGEGSAAARLAQIRLRANQYSENYKSPEQIREGQLQMYQDQVKQNQFSDANNVDDFGTGLIRGLYGGRLATGKDAIRAAGDLGLDVTKLSLDKDKLIQGTDENVAGLMKHLGEKKLKEMGIKDAAGMKGYLNSPVNQKQLLDEFGNSGGFEFKGDTLSLMDEKNVQKGISELEHKAKVNLLKQTGMIDAERKYKNTDYVRKEGETDEEYDKNKAAFDAQKDKDFRNKLAFHAGKMEKESWNGKDPKAEWKTVGILGGSVVKHTPQMWSKMDDTLKKYVEGDKEAGALYNAWEEAGVNSRGSMKKMQRDSLKKIEAELEREKKAGATGKGMDEDSFAEFIATKQANIEDLKESLNGKDASIQAGNATITVNGPVTVTGKEKP